MSVHQATLQALIEMGIHAPLARAAAQRFENADAAVNWCFGDGANWNPDDDMRPSRPVPPPPSSAPPPPEVTRPGTTVEHREVAQTQSDTSSSHTLLDARSPPLPPRARPLPSPGRQSPLPLADKNPFRSSLKLDTRNPFLQSAPPPQDAQPETGDDDAELQKALALSRGEEMDVDKVNDADNEEDKWDLAARKVRTSGPPPSPTLEAQSGPKPTFAPTEKTDIDGSLAVAPFDWEKHFSEQNTLPHRSKEDEEMEKAIADSLMTASFHSAASAPRDEDLPKQVSRDPGTPLVLYSHSGQTAASSMLQGLLAIPRFREVAMGVQCPTAPGLSRTLIEQLRRIAVASDDLRISYIDVDKCIQQIDPDTSGKQLPPIKPVHEFTEHLTDTIYSALLYNRDEDHEYWEDEDLPQPLEVFACSISTTPGPQTCVTFFRDQLSYDIHSHMARVLWSEESNGTIHHLPDILTVYLAWSSSAKREVWKLDKEIVMDRYLTKNAAWAVNVRAMQSVAEGKARRLREKIENLTTHDGHDVTTTITNTIKYYEAYPGKDEIEVAHRSELSAKLRQIHDKLQAKVAELREELEAVEEEVHGGSFNTDDPKLNEHVYRLRAVLYHDGALLGTRHLYMYLLGDEDQWWRIQEHEAMKVDWSDVASDSTGMYMDGGAYCVLYERISPRLEPYGCDNDEQQAPQTQVPEAASQLAGVAASQDSTTVPSAPPEPEAPHQTAQVSPSAPAPSAPAQVDLLGDEPDMAVSPKATASEHPHRPLPKVPVQVHQDEPPRQDGKLDEDVTMT